MVQDRMLWKPWSIQNQKLLGDEFVFQMDFSEFVLGLDLLESSRDIKNRDM